MNGIYSKRYPPKELLAHQRLLVRLPQNHEKYQLISDKIYQISAGYAGEVEVDQILVEIGLPKEATVFKDLRLEVLPGFYIQLDTLIITRKCIILLEVKKYSGTVSFDEDIGKTTKVSPNRELEKYDCVVHQVDRAVHGLTVILQNSPYSLPIYPIIVMANSKTEISLYPKTMPVKYKKQLPKYIRQLNSNAEMVSVQEWTKVKEHIARQVRAQIDRPLCKRYAIPASELRKGVLCLQCNHVMKKSQGRTWICEGCGMSNPLAAKEAVLDWFCLVNTTLTNKQLCSFLYMDSPSATRVFCQVKLKKVGHTSNTYYEWDHQ